MRKSRLFLAAIAALSIGFLAACGGDEEGTSQGSGASRSSQGSAINVSEISTSIGELSSFRFDAHLKLDVAGLEAPATSEEDGEFGAVIDLLLSGFLNDIKVEGEVVAPDKAHFKVSFGGEAVEYIQIGEKAWLKTGGSWTETDSLGEFSLDEDSSTLDFATDLLPQEVLDSASTSKEKVNGVDTTKYSFDEEALKDAGLELEESTTGSEEISRADLDLWLTGDGIPVKLAIDYEGTDADGQDSRVQLELNIKDLNSTSIEIKAPI